MPYTGGAYDTTIPDDYVYEDFMRDMELAAPLAICLHAKEEHREFAHMLAGILLANDTITDAFGRSTAYMERNSVAGLWEGMVE